MYSTTIHLLNEAAGTTVQFQRSFPYMPAAQSWIVDGLKWLDGTGFTLRSLSIVHDATEVSHE